MKKSLLSFILTVAVSLFLCSCSEAPDTELEDLLDSLETSYLPGQEPVTQAPPEPFIETLTGQISEINETVFTIKTADKKRYTVETADAVFYGSEAKVGLTAVVTYVNYGDKIKTINATSVLIEDVNNYTEDANATTAVTKVDVTTESTTDEITQVIASEVASEETTAVTEADVTAESTTDEITEAVASEAASEETPVAPEEATDEQSKETIEESVQAE